MTIRLFAGMATLAALVSLSSPAYALDLGSLAGKAAKGGVEKEVNTRLLAESRKNQCSFKTDSDELAPGCDAKLKKLADALVQMKAKLKNSGVGTFRFEVSGHTDTSGSAAHNKELSGKRAAAIASELVKRGVPRGEITSIGMGSDRPQVSPDNTPAKKAKNRRYEIQVRL